MTTAEEENNQDFDTEADLSGWQVLRQRTDKTANAIKTVLSIIKTIREPVYEEELKGLLEELQSHSFDKNDNQAASDGT